MTRARMLFRLGFVAALLPLGACGDILEVESPGKIPDENLNDIKAVPSLVVGMSFDLSEGFDDIMLFDALAAGELYHGGSYDWAKVPDGVILPEDVNFEWESIHQARWVAEDGLRRMQQIEGFDFESSAYTARAYLLAGFANRIAGENVCEAVFDGGAPVAFTEHFVRADSQFTRAIEIGTIAEADDIVTAAYGGRASVRAWLGDWDAAVADAQQVPIDFIYNAVYSTNSGDEYNDLVYETYNRYEYSVYSTEWANYPDDPRVPWVALKNPDGSDEVSANGRDPMYQQQKYPEDGADIPLTKGTEMLVLRAEAALRSGSGTAIDDAMQLINDQRAFYGMDPLPVPTTLAAAWDILHVERGAVTWLEGRRLWDLHRWIEEGEASPAYHPFLADRDRCIPISEDELNSNPNIP